MSQDFLEMKRNLLKPGKGLQCRECVCQCWSGFVAVVSRKVAKAQSSGLKVQMLKWG